MLPEPAPFANETMKLVKMEKMVSNCLNCSARVTFYDDDVTRIYSYGYRIKHHNKSYLMLFALDIDPPEFSIWENKELISIRALPVITPENALQKLQTYLAFL